MTNLAIAAGYNELYSLKEVGQEKRNLLYLYLTALNIWLLHDDSDAILSMASVRNMLSKARAIYSGIDCETGDETIESVNADNIFGGSYVVTATSGGTTIINEGGSTPSPKALLITGDLLISGGYGNTAYAGYDLLVFYNGVKWLKKDIDYTVRTTGGFDLLIEGPFTSEDEFYMQPNGLL
jgi:hypothetical protein